MAFAPIFLSLTFGAGVFGTDVDFEGRLEERDPVNIRDIMNIELFTVTGTEITVASVVYFTGIVLVSIWVSWALRRIVGRALDRGGLRRPGTKATVLRLLHYAILGIGVAVALQTIGISLVSLFAAGAVVAVAIGFALQTVLQNFVSGVILLAERSITQYDVLEVEGKVVRVEKLGTRATVARTRDDDEIIIPNSVLVQSSVTNLTLSDEVHRIRAQVGVAYGSDMDEVERALIRAAHRIENRSRSRDPLPLLLEFGNSSVVWELSVWSTDPWAARITRSDLNKAMWHELKEAGITIAFPQLDLHIVSDARARPADDN